MLYMGLIASFLVFIGLIGAWFLRIPNQSQALDVRIFGYWLVMTFFVLVLQKPAWFIPLSIPMILIAQPKDPLERFPFYIAALFVMPSSAVFDIPMIGLNYLMSMNNAKLVSIFIIIPLLFISMPRKYKLRFNLLDLVVLVFCLWKLALAFRGVPITTGLRYGVDTVLIWLLPYFAMSRLVVNWRTTNSVMKTWLLLATILSMISMISVLRQWNMYSLIDIFRSFEGDYYRRGGFLRVAVTFSTSLLAYFLAIGMITLEVVRKHQKISSMKAWLMRGIFLLAIFMTGSRAGWLMAPICYGVYFIFDQKSPILKWGALTAGVVGGYFFYTIYTTDALSSVDNFGTFQYRKDLAEASKVQVDSAFWAGDQNFIESEHLAHMVQGEGIIDIVNSYLQIVLLYGVIGLFLFALMFIVPIISLVRLKSSWAHLAPHEQQWLRDWRAVLLAAFIALGMLLVTVSMVSYTVSILMALMAITRGLTGQVQKRAESGTGFFSDFKPDSPASIGKAR